MSPQIPLSDDVKLSQRQWERLHKKESLKRLLDTDPTIKSYLRFLFRYQKDFQRGTVLDLGCGIAWVASLLAREGVRIVGVDISKGAIAKSRRLFQRQGVKGRFVLGDLLHLPFRDNQFSFIWSCMSLEYVRDTQRAVREAYRVLTPGGRIIAIVPVISLTTLTYHQLRGDIPNLPIIRQIMEFVHIRLLKGKYMHYGYEQSFTIGGLRRLFRNAGFSEIHIDFFDTHYPILFIPRFLRRWFRELLRWRPFWPLVYVEATKS